MTNTGIGNCASAPAITSYSSSRPQSARSPVAMTQSGAGSRCAIAVTAFRSIALVSIPPYANTPGGRTWKSVICATIIGLLGSSCTTPQSRVDLRRDSHRRRSPLGGTPRQLLARLLHQIRRLLDEPVVPRFRRDVAAHDAGDDFALRPPD